MTYAFYSCICLGLVVIRTTIFPIFPILDNFFDLLLPVIVYLGFFRSVRESILMLIILGIVMDSLSGVPFGLHLASYAWLFVLVKWLKQFLHISNYFLWSFVLTLGVLIENIMLTIVENLLNPGWGFLANAVEAVLIQLVLAALTGPLMILLIRSLHEIWNQRLYRIISKGSDEGG